MNEQTSQDMSCINKDLKDNVVTYGKCSNKINVSFQYSDKVADVKASVKQRNF